MREAFWVLLTVLALGVRTPAVSVLSEGPAVRNSLGMELVRIPAGRFAMGREGSHWDQAPVHEVVISRAYLMSASEVTVEQYRHFLPDADVTNSDGLAGGVSYRDAEAFCQWLSEREGRPYRLPTEAEWEYACRAGSDTPFWSGEAPPEPGATSPWGLTGMHDGVLEWCYDWYGDYAAAAQEDPIGAASGQCRVVRGGGLDSGEPQYRTAFARAGMPPAFGLPRSARRAVTPVQPDARKPGLVGTWFGDPGLTRPMGDEVLRDLGNDWSRDSARGGAWSAEWRGLIEAPATGAVTFAVVADRGVRIAVDGQVVVDRWDGDNRGPASVTLTKGRQYPIVVSYSHVGGAAFLRVAWSWDGTEVSPVPPAALSHLVADEEGLALSEGATGGRHRIGFRVVQAPLPPTAPLPAPPYFVQQCVGQKPVLERVGHDADVPYFRKRPLLPTPPETGSGPEQPQLIEDAGLHPSFRGHNHCPALVACPNGDLLMVIYTSYSEYEPEVSLIASRLRHGADEWDMPSRFVDCPGANDHAPLLWRDGERLFLFWGSPRLAGGFPFQWITSDDNGATWSEVHFPVFEGRVGPHSRQPINSAFRAADGTIYVSSDGEGGSSLLWASSDGGRLWRDTGGRTFGRHTTFAQLTDGRILGMGGKNTDIEGYMPRSISNDGGRTWEVSGTPFPALGGNQRPSLLRLRSGRLFFAGDFQRAGGAKPPGIAQSGSYVALSEDEGETWHVRQLDAAQPHENPDFLAGAGTIGYSAACQTADGLVHLITTMNRPCLHLAMNEAWIMADEPGDADASAAGHVLEGRQTWHYPNGRTQYEVEHRQGRKVGRETHWSPGGDRQWEWRHRADGIATWTQWWDNGQVRARSRWRDFRAEGLARRWDRLGRLVSERVFVP